MNSPTVPAVSHDQRLLLARQAYFSQGQLLPDGLIDPLIIRSWERCRRFGLGDVHELPAMDPLDRVALKTEQDRNRELLSLGRPVMEHVLCCLITTGRTRKC